MLQAPLDALMKQFVPPARAEVDVDHPCLGVEYDELIGGRRGVYCYHILCSA